MRNVILGEKTTIISTTCNTNDYVSSGVDNIRTKMSILNLYSNETISCNRLSIKLDDAVLPIKNIRCSKQLKLTIPSWKDDLFIFDTIQCDKLILDGDVSRILCTKLSCNELSITNSSLKSVMNFIKNNKLKNSNVKKLTVGVNVSDTTNVVNIGYVRNIVLINEWFTRLSDMQNFKIHNNDTTRIKFGSHAITNLNIITKKKASLEDMIVKKCNIQCKNINLQSSEITHLTLTGDNVTLTNINDIHSLNLNVSKTLKIQNCTFVNDCTNVIRNCGAKIVEWDIIC